MISILQRRCQGVNYAMQTIQTKRYNKAIEGCIIYDRHCIRIHESIFNYKSRFTISVPNIIKFFNKSVITDLVILDRRNEF